LELKAQKVYLQKRVFPLFSKSHARSCADEWTEQELASGDAPHSKNGRSTKDATGADLERGESEALQFEIKEVAQDGDASSMRAKFDDPLVPSGASGPDSGCASKLRKNDVKINMNMLAHLLKDNVSRIFLEPDRERRLEAVKGLLGRASQFKVPIRPGRKYTRKKRPRPVCRMNMKTAI
jgi:hypothetical protein